MFHVTFTLPGDSRPITRSWLTNDDLLAAVRQLLRDGVLSISVTRE